MFYLSIILLLFIHSIICSPLLANYFTNNCVINNKLFHVDQQLESDPENKLKNFGNLNKPKSTFPQG
jgi:hypothetical protein